jgi:hypothetical protein
MNVFETRTLKFSFIFLIGEVLFCCLLWSVQQSNVALNQELTVLNDKLQTVFKSDFSSLQSRRLSSSLVDELSQCCCVAPTMAPTYLPTVVPSFFPTTLVTDRPTVVPTFPPTLIPTAKPTTLIPTVSPTIYFTVICATGEPQCSGNPAYTNFQITATTNIVVVGSGNHDMFTFYPTLSQNQISVLNFNLNSGNILSFIKFSDLAYAQITQNYDPSVGMVLTLPDKQQIIVHDLAFGIPSSCMVFPAATSPPSPPSPPSPDDNRVASIVGGVLSPIAYSALCYVCNYPLKQARKHGIPAAFFPSGGLYYFCLVTTGVANHATEMAREYFQKSHNAVNPYDAKQ